MSTYAPGDLVRLKSGGPAMTVVAVDETGACTCAWFRHNRQYEASFVAVALEPAEEPTTQ